MTASALPAGLYGPQDPDDVEASGDSLALSGGLMAEDMLSTCDLSACAQHMQEASDNLSAAVEALRHERSGNVLPEE